MADHDSSARLVDVGLAVATTGVVSLTIGAGLEATRHPAPAAYLFAVAFGAALLVRRRRPVAVLLGTVLGIFAYYAFGFPAIGQALPAAAALYSAAELGRTRAALVVGAVLVSVATYFRISEGLPATYLLSYDLLTNVALVVAAVALGVSVRTRRRSREDQERLRAAAVAEQRADAERRLQEQRVRIARDLHDSLGHTVSVIAVHANVAGEAVGRDDDLVAASLGRIRAATSSTLRELRSTVRLLTSPDEPARGTVGLSGVRALAESTRGAGLDVVLDLAVEDGAVDSAIDAAAYRVVQEALTNALRHARATTVQVSAVVADGWLRIEVVDDGVGPAPGASVRGGDGPDPGGVGGGGGGVGGGGGAVGGAVGVGGRVGSGAVGVGVGGGAGAGAGAGAAPGPGAGPRAGVGGGAAADVGGVAPGAGQGLRGMAERVRLLGGSMTTGPAPAGGFRVAASLPTRLGS